jgi:hypothetical protein
MKGAIKLYKLAITFLLGAASFFLVTFCLKKILESKKKKGNKGGRKPEFKKIVVASVLTTYFLGVGFGAYIVFKYDYSQLAPWLTFIGAPTTGAILSYCYVIRTENAIKLKQLYPAETEGYTVDVNNTSV